ncbi:WhiB transcriptional factor [Mycobacterium phage Yunkel11]|uniref:WhiB family transcription factor n=1 Tax=Mycobacterium phage Yunkel11 TaxID=2599886 RepID=A0A5J6TC97_9CAUD|nr:WhiB transcriptional factor [Mycobacterium phage Yunkel11]QFG08440.1 WhiB family transcription factor [Mycobacterium phage Yunkel11]
MSDAMHFDDNAEGWRAAALCAQTDPEIFFPEQGGSTREAKRVCGACRVSDQCLAWALAQPVNPTGIWGGTTERERRRIKRGLKGVAA